MRDSLQVTGIVLSVMPIGEYDKRLIILTKERGKISAFAKGARKTNSAFLACSQPFTFGTFSVFEGKSAYTIVGVEIDNYFQALREDLAMIYHGMYFCEFAEYYTKEDNDEVDVLKLLYQSLRALSNKQLDVTLVRAVFELKIITLNGEGPLVYECQKCGSKEDLLFFSLSAGGVLCSDCKRKEAGFIKINTSTLYALQYVTSTPVEKLFQFTLAPEVLREFAGIVDKYKKAYVDHTMKSEEMLKQLI